MSGIGKAREEFVTADPRYLYTYSPEGTTADQRYVFRAGERSPERTIRGLLAAYEWLLDNPPTPRDHERAERHGPRNY